MPRLPQSGADTNQWGDILNDFLAQEHNADGSQKPLPQSKITNLTSDLATKLNITDPKVTADQAPATASIRTLGYGASQAAQGSAVNTRLGAVENNQVFVAYNAGIYASQDPVRYGLYAAESTWAASPLRILRRGREVWTGGVVEVAFADLDKDAVIILPPEWFGAFDGNAPGSGLKVEADLLRSGSFLTEFIVSGYLAPAYDGTVRSGVWFYLNAPIFKKSDGTFIAPQPTDVVHIFLAFSNSVILQIDPDA